MIIVTRAAVADAKAILALQRRAYESEAKLYSDWNIPPLIQTVESLRVEIEATTVLKAVKDGGIVGSVRARQNDATCQIGRLIVEPDLQGQGIGSDLLREIENAHPTAERFELFTGSRSEGNIRLYRQHGIFSIFNKLL